MANGRIIGSVAYRNEGDGCLTSKYVNAHSPPYVECCKLQPGTKTQDDLFSGRYDTVWLEVANGTVSHHRGTLLIELQLDNSYRMSWEVEGERWFTGVGMIFNDNLLVGAYWEA